jgi:hypothetical protein
LWSFKKREKWKIDEGNGKEGGKTMRERIERERRKEKEETILCVAPDSTKTLIASDFISNWLGYGRAFMCKLYSTIWLI